MVGGVADWGNAPVAADGAEDGDSLTTIQYEVTDLNISPLPGPNE